MALFVFLMFFILFSIIGCVIYLLYWPIKSYMLGKDILSTKRSRQINYIYVAVIFLCICTATYIGLYPDEDFYREEFKDVTLRDLPESAEFISKSADYPDFHGDYCSKSEVKLSKDDFSKLLKELYKDKRISKPGYNTTNANNKYDFYLRDGINHIFIRYVEDKPDHHLKIEFSKDLTTIFVDVCKI